MGRPETRNHWRGIGAPTDSGSLGAFALALLPYVRKNTCDRHRELCYFGIPAPRFLHSDVLLIYKGNYAGLGLFRNKNKAEWKAVLGGHSGCLAFDFVVDFTSNKANWDMGKKINFADIF
jgi:hypothetical protein